MLLKSHATITLKFVDEICIILAVFLFFFLPFPLRKKNVRKRTKVDTVQIYLNTASESFMSAKITFSSLKKVEKWIFRTT